MRNREQWRQAYEPLPKGLHQAVCYTLNNLEEKKMKKASVRAIAIALALVLAVCGTAVALIESKTADIFGWLYGDEYKQALLAGDVAVSGESVTLGDIIYTVDDVIYENGTLYGTATIKAKEDANIVLIAPDYSVNDPAGYLVYYGEDEEIPADAKSYQERAYETAARVMCVNLVPNGVLADGELTCTESIGCSFLPQTDGTIVVCFEISNEEGNLARRESYELSLYIYNYEVDDTDCAAPRETWEVNEAWTLAVKPEAQQ